MKQNGEYVDILVIKAKVKYNVKFHTEACHFLFGEEQQNYE